jgi:hypothetical protein
VTSNLWRKTDAAAKDPAKLTGMKIAKEEHQLQKQKECAIHAQARETVDMATTSLRKAQVFQDQVVLALFMMPDKTHLSQQAYDYLTLRRDEEMVKLQCRLQAEKIAVAQEAAEAA